MDKPLLNGEKNAYPSLKKAKDEGRVIVYVDECACYLLPLLAHSWAPKGQTPVIIEQAGRAHLSLIAAIAPNGRIYVAGQDQPFSGEDIVWFLSKLCSRYRKRDLLVIWQGRPLGLWCSRISRFGSLPKGNREGFPTGPQRFRSMLRFRPLSVFLTSVSNGNSGIKAH
ncbi:transposase [Spirosoma soli]|uniref:Transposase n=1 Tax=Spirosoma soli TaxID=1770529 RepID=A0ABW5M819_9BACT